MADARTLTNAVGKPFTWSFSAIGDFDSCPNQYAAKRFFESVKDTDNEYNIWGSRVHKALELRLKSGIDLAPEFEAYEPYCRTIERAPGFLYTECQIAFDRDLVPTNWMGPKVWGRSVLDVLLVHENKAWIWDWKTGKIKDNDLQLRIFAAVASLIYPEVTEYVTRFVWLKHNQVTGLDIKAEMLPEIWDEIYNKVRLMELAWEYQNFPCNPSGLCRGWCPVQDCEHWRPKR